MLRHSNNNASDIEMALDSDVTMAQSSTDYDNTSQEAHSDEEEASTYENSEEDYSADDESNSSNESDSNNSDQSDSESQNSDDENSLHSDNDIEMNDEDYYDYELDPECSIYEKYLEDDDEDEMQEQETGYDSDNPGYNEPDEPTARDIFRNLNEENLSDLLSRTDNDTITTVFDILIEAYEDNKGDKEDIKTFLGALGEGFDEFEFPDSLLEEAIDDEDHEALDLYIQFGASQENLIYKAISRDSEDVLRHLETSCDDEYIDAALEENKESALGYFLEEDFSATKQRVLTYAVDNNAPSFIKLLCERTDEEYAVDLLREIIDLNGEELITVLFEHFGLEELVELISEENAKDQINLLTIVFKQAADCPKCDPKMVSELASSYLGTMAIKSKVTQASIDDLMKALEENLHISSKLLFYHREDFNGYPRIKELRKTIANNGKLNEEQRAAANQIGIALCSANYYFSKSPYHAMEPHFSETYSRSDMQPLRTAVGKDKIRFEAKEEAPEAKISTGFGGAAHLGLYLNSHEVINQTLKIQHTLAASTALSDVSNDSKADLYDFLLEYKRSVCRYIEKSFVPTGSDPMIIVQKEHNNYPCVMIKVGPLFKNKKFSDAKRDAWVRLISCCYIGLVNYKAHHAGLDIELIKRSSFGFLTPTVAPCGEKFRINTGIIPFEYTTILIDSLKLLNDALTLIRDKSTRLDFSLPQKCFLNDTDYEDYLDEKAELKKEVSAMKNICDLIMGKIDTGGRSGAFSLMRTNVARDQLSLNVYQKLKNTDLSSVTTANALLSAIRAGMRRLNVQDKTLSYLDKKVKPIDKIALIANPIKDKKFLDCMTQIYKIVSQRSKIFVSNTIAKDFHDFTVSQLNNAINNKDIKDIYYYAQIVNESIYINAICDRTAALDGGPSDSEVETDDSAIFAKKRIVANGTRATLASINSSVNFLTSKKLSTEIFLQGQYYETNEKLLKKLSHKTTNNIKGATILVQDMNSSHGCSLIKSESLPSNIKIVILDSTSATIAEQEHWVDFLKKSDHLKAICFASSGLKNEQIGSDKNHYGTIRIVAKKEKYQNILIKHIDTFESPIKSLIANRYRRANKILGNVPTNQLIITRFTRF